MTPVGERRDRRRARDRYLVEQACPHRLDRLERATGAQCDEAKAYGLVDEVLLPRRGVAYTQAETTAA